MYTAQATLQPVFFSENLFLYLWLVFKSGFYSCAGYDGKSTVSYSFIDCFWVSGRSPLPNEKILISVQFMYKMCIISSISESLSRHCLETFFIKCFEKPYVRNWTALVYNVWQSMTWEPTSKRITMAFLVATCFKCYEFQ